MKDSDGIGWNDSSDNDSEWSQIVWWFSGGLVWLRFAVVYTNQLPVAYAKGNQGLHPQHSVKIFQHFQHLWNLSVYNYTAI